MPYIKKEDRLRLDKWIDESGALTEGELNYVFTRLLLNSNPQERHYKDWNALIGVLEACKLEFYRRRVAPYEDDAIKRNGDINDV